MDKTKSYAPPSVWVEDKSAGGEFANINRPVAGPTHQKELKTGQHPFQLYSLATPNGVKVTILLEELLEAGETGAEYDAHLIRINEGAQFSSGFVDVNPNSKIPALLDQSSSEVVRVFESGSILLYLAEKFARFIPKETQARTECLNWLFWQMGSAPMLGGGFGHFYAYAPEKLEYPINRYTMEVKRQLDVLDQRLAQSQYLGGETYTIADIAVYPWYGVLVEGGLYNAREFIDADKYENVIRWAQDIAARPAVMRGRRVNRVWGPEAEQLAERHHRTDFDAGN